MGGVTDTSSTLSVSRRRRRLLVLVLALCGLLVFSGLIELGNWQLRRRVWKLDLIQRVDTRVHAPAEIAPPPRRWPLLNAENDEYRQVWIEGHFLPGRDVRVAASTTLGSGYWVLTPLRRDDGSVVLINRGFIALGVDPAPPPEGRVQVAGLLRMSQPGGGFLRSNEPAEGRWYSRDTGAISAVLGLDNSAPFFIDAAAGSPGSAASDAADNTGNQPVGGLTVIQFHNSHLVYAITWYGLAAMVFAAGCFLLREERRRSKGD